LQNRVCVIGLGVVGYPTAEYISEQGFQVSGYDVLHKNSDKFFTTTRFDEVPKDTDIFIITVSTGINRGEPDLTNLYDACEKISTANPDSLVCVESTVPVGTCREISKKFGLPNFVHVPHRYWTQNPKEFGVRQTRVFGAVNDRSLEEGQRFYNKLSIPLCVVPEIEIAEMSKIAENAYVYVNIAFAESLRMVCEDLGLKYGCVRDACNTKWNIELMEARDGIWGACLPKDIRYLLFHSSSDPLLAGAIRADAKYKKRFGPKEMPKPEKRERYVA
jgi:nucleotide sugar dehydrogenase